MRPASTGKKPLNVDVDVVVVVVAPSGQALILRHPLSPVQAKGLVVGPIFINFFGR
jgi:hypothetical protein